MRLTIWRLWVQIPAPNTGWIFLTLTCCKIVLCLIEKTENKQKEAGFGSLKKFINRFTCFVESKPLKRRSGTQWYFPIKSKWVFYVRCVKRHPTQWHAAMLIVGVNSRQVSYLHNTKLFHVYRGNVLFTMPFGMRPRIIMIFAVMWSYHMLDLQSLPRPDWQQVNTVGMRCRFLQFKN